MHTYLMFISHDFKAHSERDVSKKMAIYIIHWQMGESQNDPDLGMPA